MADKEFTCEEDDKISEAKNVLENIGVTGLADEDYLALYQLLPAPQVKPAPPRANVQLWLDCYEGWGSSRKREASYYAVGVSIPNAIINLLRMLEDQIPLNDNFDWQPLFVAIGEVSDGTNMATYTEMSEDYSFELHLRER